MAVRRAILAALVLLGAGNAGAQDPLDPRESQVRRQIRSLENRAVTDPVGAGFAADAVRRELLRGSGGGDFTPEQRRLERRLERVRRPLPPPAAGQEHAPSGEKLPFSAGAGQAPLPASSEPLAIVRRLLARAADGVEAGRMAQARSDLAAAAGELDRLPPEAAEGAAAVRRDLDALAGRVPRGH
ncbi:hypothetical protein SH611_17490 [Geminicoccaceae bacterium 1502E]|nr:hypothetical protein [Geminicoccaceae bacterium 1502E]